MNLELKRARLPLAALAGGLLCFAPNLFAGACKFSETTADGQPMLVLENDYVRVEVEPADGGRISSLVHKSTQTELAGRPAGLLRDRLAQTGARAQPWVNGHYEYSVGRKDAEGIEVTLRRQQEGGPFHALVFEKTLRLGADSPMLQVHYALIVTENHVTSFIAAPWFSNSIGAWTEPTSIYLPLASGVERIDHDPAGGLLPQRFDYDLARGWTAVQGRKSGAGLAAQFEFGRVMCSYVGSTDQAHANDWIFRSQEVRNGDRMETAQQWIPFSGIPAVSGVGEGVVAGIVVPAQVAEPGGKQPVKVGVYSSRAGTLRVRVGCEKLPGRLAAVVEERALNLAADSAEDFAFDWTPADEGTYAIHGEVFAGDRKVCDFEQPCVVGKPAPAYRLPDESRRLGDAAERFGQVAEAAARPEVRAELSEDLVTRHVPWAKPYYKGSVKALFIIGYLGAREVVELAQRMQLEHHVSLAIIDGREDIGDLAGVSDVTAEQDLIKCLETEKYDVIVVAGPNAYLKSREFELLARQVKAGTGLLWVGLPVVKEMAALLPMTELYARSEKDVYWQAPEKPNQVTQVLPLEALPPTGVEAYRTQDVVAAAGTAKGTGKDLPLVLLRNRPGQGRVVAMPYRTSGAGTFNGLAGITPFDSADGGRPPWPYWEYQDALIVRSILWAAHKESDVWPAVKAQAAKVAPGRLGAAQIEIGLQGATEGLPGLEIEATVRDAFLDPLFKAVKPWQEPTVRFETGEVLGAGRHFVDIRVLSQGKVVSFGAVELPMDGGSAIESVTLEKPAYAQVFQDGDEVRFKVKCANLADGEQIMADLLDGVGRRLDRVTAPAAAEVEISLHAREALHGAGLLDIALRKGDTLLDRRKTTVTLVTRQIAAQSWDDEIGVAWGCIGGYQYERNGRIFADQVRRLGYNAALISTNWYPDDHIMVLRDDLHPLPYGTVPGEFRPLDPKYLKDSREACAKSAQLAAPMKPIVYCFSDEMAYDIQGRDLTSSPPALAAFRDWLKKEYGGSLDALNQSWETAFAGWDSVMPLTTPEDAKAAGKYASWTDFRNYGNFVVTEYHRALVEEVRKYDPKPRCGISGTQVPATNNGCDWARLCRVFDYASGYGGGGELSFLMYDLTADFRNAQYLYLGIELPVAEFWNAMLKGQAGWSACAVYYMINPDLTLSRMGRQMEEVTRFWRQGFIKLVLNSTWDRDRIALHYSMPSIIVSELCGGATNAQRWGWLHSLQDLGYLPRYVSYLEIEEGKLTRQSFDAIILPGSVALSAKEAAAIEKFVAEGGVAIADVPPGITDAHGKFLSGGALDKVFGVVQAAAPKLKSRDGTLTYSGGAPGPDLGNGTEKTSVFSETLKATTGRPGAMLDAVPAYVVNSFGKGKALLLNTSVSAYVSLRANHLEGPLRERVGRIMEWAGCRPPVEVKDEAGQRVPMYLSRYRQGKNLYVGLASTDRKPVTIEFPQEGHVYEMRTGKYHGLAKSVKLDLPLDDGMVLSSLAYKVNGLRVTGPSAPVPAGQSAKIEIALDTTAPPEVHCLHVEVFGPDGKEISYYAQNILLAGGKGAVEIPFRCDVAGACKVTIRDVATGVTGAATFSVAK